MRSSVFVLVVNESYNEKWFVSHGYFLLTRCFSLKVEEHSENEKKKRVVIAMIRHKKYIKKNILLSQVCACVYKYKYIDWGKKNSIIRNVFCNQF